MQVQRRVGGSVPVDECRRRGRGGGYWYTCGVYPRMSSGSRHVSGAGSVVTAGRKRVEREIYCPVVCVRAVMAGQSANAIILLLFSRATAEAKQLH